MRNDHRRARKAEDFGDISDKRLICSSLDGRRLQSDLEPSFRAFAMNASDCCTFRARLNTNRKRAAIRVFAQKTYSRIKTHFG